MKTEIIVGIVSSVITAMLAVVVGIFFDLFEKKIDENVVADVADEILTDKANSRILIRILKESDEFQGRRGPEGPKGPVGQKGNDGDWAKGSINPKVNIARQICYSALTRQDSHSLIVIPLENSSIDLDAACQSKINESWNAGGVAKSNYFTQDCGDLENIAYGGSYTSYVTESQFESNRNLYGACTSGNSFICCSTQFTN